MYEKEMWRDIDGYDGRYRISNHGRLMSFVFRPEGRLLKPVEHKCRYGHMSLRLTRPDGTKTSPYVHRLVLEAFVGKCPYGYQARHLDGNPANNNLNNLIWDSPKNNQQDRVKHGTSNRGERYGANKIKEDDIPVILEKISSGESLKEIANTYGVTIQNISAIKRGVSWSWLTKIEYKGAQA